MATRKQNKKNKNKIPLNELSYDSFDKMSAEEILETYEDEIKDYGEWIWREQDRGGPMYSLEQCIEQAKTELLEGAWGPAAE